MSDRAAPSARSLLWVLVVLALPAAAAPQGPPAVSETQRVTAFDLLVELRRPRERGKSVEPPADLALEELTVLWDGEPLPLVGMARGDRDPEAWRLVIYIDRALASNHSIRWAAMELAERVDRLTALGEVEVVVADPEPRRALAPTRDPRLLDGALSGIFLAPADSADLIVRREEYLLDHPRGPPAGPGEKRESPAYSSAGQRRAPDCNGRRSHRMYGQGY